MIAPGGRRRPPRVGGALPPPRGSAFGGGRLPGADAPGYYRPPLRCSKPGHGLGESAMRRARLSLWVVLTLALCGLVAAQTAVPLVTGQGVVDKVEKGTVTVQPRGPGGQF